MRLARFLLLLILFAACKKDKTLNPDDGNPSEYIISRNIEVNPSGYAPLSGLLTLETTEDTKVAIRVVGKSAAADVTHEFGTIAKSHSLPVLGLYGKYENEVEVTLFNASGKDLGTITIPVNIDSLSGDLPAIVIDVPPGASQSDMTLVSYFGSATQGGLPHKPFIFDNAGDVRWYVDYSNHATLNKMNVQNGVELLQNGNLYFGDIASNAVYEINMFGDVLNSWSLNGLGYTFHHQVLEKPDGNFLITVTKLGIPTVEDHIIEISRSNGQVVNVWDFRELLQYDRTAWTTNTEDWLHLNAVEYDPDDETVVASGRTQGVVKVDASNNVKWILAPHRGWGMAGNGVDLKTRLLTPLDAQEAPITDADVLDGAKNHPDFEWNWYQHAPKHLDDGTWLLFDNGASRNYSDVDVYSRAVRYHIDETAMTVRQVWNYGKERGVQTYAGFVSDVDYNEENGIVTFGPGAINSDGPRHGKVVEVDSNSGNVVFEATITPPATGGVTFHRTERMSLYR